MTAKVLLHLDLEDEDRLQEALGNVHNLMVADAVTEAVVRVVVNGLAVRLFRKERAGRMADRIRALSEADVSFLICRNSLKHLGIDESELLESCQVIPAGIVELYSLQESGFAYVKP
jgi:intracellular sulfur oxidation DsrE/DsrF family protein